MANRTPKLDRVLSIAAILLSLATLVVLIYQSRLMREHEEKSVLPKLELWNTPQADQYNLNLLNMGLGPAVVERVEVHFEDSVYVLDPRDFSAQYLHTVQKDTVAFSGSNLYPGMIIPANASFPLVQVPHEGQEEEHPLVELFYFNRARVIIYYSSVYGRLWKLEGMGKIPQLLPHEAPEVSEQLFGG
ncbi:MAG: hypothetical protein AAFQ98_17505 [Bacteroidota bacterium]